MKQLITIILILLVGTQFMQSQIIGKIIDSETNASLEYATASVYNQDGKLVTGVVTNIEGDFSLEEIKSGNYFLEASFMGYTSIKTEVFNVNKKGQAINLGL